MFDQFITEDAKNSASIILIILIIIRTGGISFLPRLFIKLMRLDFLNIKLKKTNDYFFNIQLYRFINGINVDNIKTADFIDGMIKSGILKRSQFFLTCFFGPLGKKKRSKSDMTIAMIVIAYCLGAGVYMLYDRPNYKEGYAKYNIENGYYFVSEHEIYDKSASVILNKKSCQTLTDLEKIKYGLPCDYLTTDLSVKRSELIDAIGIEKNSMRAYWTLNSLFFLIAFFLTFGWYNFYKTNNKICDEQQTE
jgi:hypothetical protein